MDARARARRRRARRRRPRRGRGARHPLRVGRRRRHLARRPDPARDRRRTSGTPLAAGLAQRVRALDAFVADVYAERRIVAEGVVPAARARHRRVPRAGDAGLPAARDGAGSGSPGSTSCATARARWLVLEDNVRTPSGLGYWPAARAATLEALAPPPAALPRLARRPRRLRCAACSATGRAVVLTDGAGQLRLLGARLDRRAARAPAGRAGRPRGARRAAAPIAATPIDTIYRRTNADRVDSEVGRLLQPVLAAGGVELVNCFGTGVADDKLAHAYVHDMIRFYLGEEPLLDQVETFDLGEPDDARARARRVRRAGDQGPRLLRRAGRRRLPARRARRRRGAARAGARRARRTTSRSGWSPCPPIRPRSTARSRPATSTCDPSC